MTAIEWLSRGRQINDRLKELERERQNVFYLCTNTTRSIIADKVRTSPGNSSEQRMIHLAAIATEIESERDKLIDVIAEIVKVIHRVPDITLRRLLSLRYIEFMTWVQVADEMGYNDYHLRKNLHKKALCAVEELMQAESRGGVQYAETEAVEVFNAARDTAVTC